MFVCVRECENASVHLYVSITPTHPRVATIGQSHDYYEEKLKSKIVFFMEN